MKNLNLTILELLKQGLNPSKICKQLNISKPLMSYYLKQLRLNGNIIKKGYGTWEVKDLTLKMRSSKKIRGHAFIWTVKLNKSVDWTKYLTSYKLIRNKIPRIIINNSKVWLGKNTITIYDNRSFYGKNSIESRKYAVNGLKLVLEALEKQTINLKPYKFKVCKEHYSMIKNELARQYNSKKEKMIIKDDIEGEWLWIDDSESLNELENKNIVRSKQVQDWWNDNKKFDFKVTPTFLMESINKLVEVNTNLRKDLNYVAQNQVSHVRLIEKASKVMDKLDKKLTNRYSNKSSEDKYQTTLF